MERLDNIGFGNLELYQEPSDFCYGIDAVLLSHFAACDSYSKGSIADLGCGNGVIPLILSHKIPEATITGFEVRKEAWSLANKSVKHNNLEGRISIVNSDIMDIPGDYKGVFDMVTSNPPYVGRGAGLLSDNKSKLIARHETTATIYDFMKVAAGIINDKGSVCVVYRPKRLGDLLEAGRESGLEPAIMRMVCPHRGEDANIVLVRFCKGRHSELKVMPELIVRDERGEYTDEIKNIYEI